MSLFDAVVLGALQGLTEFLPVSSSGHLAILEHIWRLDPAVRLPLATLLHLGTAGAMLVYFGKRLARLGGDCFGRDRLRRRQGWRLVGFIVVGSVPAAIVGLLLHDRIEVAFASPMLVAAMLLVTGILLFGTWFVKTDGRPLGWSRAIVIGIAQAIAILPGISRSGATIAAGVYSGVGREESFEFSFLLAVPAILGAALLELRNSELSALNPMTAAAGVLVALMSGILALALLKRAVVGRRLYLFAFYCWLAGLGALVFVR